MKRIVCFLLAASFIAAVSCTKEEDTAKPEKSGRVLVLTAHADQDVDTKTSLDGVTVKWSDRDFISAFAPTSWGEYHMERSSWPDVSADGTIAHFSFYDFEEDEEIKYAVYAPLSTIVVDGDEIHLDIPTSQEGRDGSFGEYANIAVARVTDINDLYFKNVGGLLAVKLKGAGSHQVASITIAGEEVNGGGMTGQTVVQIDEDEVVTTVCTGKDHVTVHNLAKAEVGSTFYAVVAPGTYTNVTITFTDTQGAKATYTKKTDMVVERNGNLLIGGFDIPEDKWVQINPEDPIEFEDPLVKAALVAGSDDLTVDTNGDGEISYAEAAAVTSLNQLFLRSRYPDNAKITSFDEFQYFTGVESIWGDFAGCEELTSIILPPNVTSIIEGFEMCKSLTSIILPEGLSDISYYSFLGCEALASLTLPESLTSIGEYGLAGCAITSIEIPRNVTAIGESAFFSCAYLTSVDWPDQLTSIPAQTFAHCYYLESVHLPETLVAIGDGAFSYCNVLSSISIPESVTHIGERAFERCRSLESVTLPSQLEVIEAGTFSDCESLSSIAIPETVTSIGERAFSGCESLSNLQLPSGIEAIEAETFSYCGFTTFEIPAGVTRIGEGAFSYCRSLTGVELPSGIDAIAAETFKGCSSLSALEIPAGVTSIGEAAFSYSGLVSLDLPAGIDVIEASTFEACSSLTAVNNMDNVTRIGEKAFKGCSSLTAFELPPYVEAIEAETFSGCRYLASVTIPEGVTSIGTDAFYTCRALREIALPDGLVSIGERAFYQTNLREIVLPPSLEVIEKEAFKSCGLWSVTAKNDPETADWTSLDIGEGAFGWNSSLRNVKLPETTRSIGDRAFEDVSDRLLSIRLPERVEEIGEEAFSGCSSLEEVVLSENLWSLGARAFIDCVSLTTINFPEGLSEISDGTFQNCTSLTEIVLTENIWSLGTSAFQGCSSLTSVTLMYPYYPVGIPYENPESVFADTHADLRIFVPEELLPDYQSYEEWSVYADLIYAMQ